MNNTPLPLISIQGITKTYTMGDEQVHALRGVDVTIEKGEFVAITGSSGSGKSTLMHIIGCLDEATRGTYHLNGKDVSHLSADERAQLRNQFIGFIFQRFHLLPTLNAFENIALPLRYAGAPEQVITQRVNKMLRAVEMHKRANHYPWQLSGGQQQRIAIARALVTKPTLIIADEPTGSLDSATGEIIMKLLTTMREKEGTTLLIVTHEADIAAYAERQIVVKDGNIL